MPNKKETSKNKFLSKTNVLRMLITLISYLLGIVIPDYFAKRIDWKLFLIGLLIIFAFEFLPFSVQQFLKKSRELRTKNTPQIGREYWLALAILTLNFAFIIYLLLFLMQVYTLTPFIWTLILAGLILSVLWSIGSDNKKFTPYKPVLISTYQALVIPMFSTYLQLEIQTSFMLLTLLPIFLTFLACNIAFEFEKFENDLRKLNRSFLVMVGWDQSIDIHNFLLLFSFITIGAGGLLGISWKLTWPKLLLLPLVVMQIWSFHKIKIGEKPNWRYLRISSFSLQILSLYILLLAFWFN